MEAKQDQPPAELAALTCYAPLAGLIERLTLAAENYERVIDSLPHFWQRFAREECSHKAAGIREAIAMARQCSHSLEVCDCRGKTQPTDNDAK